MSKIKLSDHFNYGPTETMYRQSSPECDILVNKQLRKTYGKKKNKVYLNDGDHIQLNLFNPLYHRIGVQLEFNGEKEEKILILNPGQKVLLDRFIDTKKKIKFGTYFVDGSKGEVKESIKKNGNMRVHFWYEKMKQPLITTLSSSFAVSGASGPSGSSGSSGSSGTGGTGKRKRTAGLPHYGKINTAYSTLGNVNGMGSVTTPADFTLDGTFTNTSTNSNSRVYTTSSIEPILEETGRVEKGAKSKQKMKETDFEVDKVFLIKEFKLLPFSKLKDSKKKAPNRLADNIKPKTVTVDVHSNYYRNTDHRIYCSNPLCGYRVRNQSWKYCPICGGEIE